MKILIADSGATKAEWTLVNGKDTKTVLTGGISPYFLDQEQIKMLLRHDLVPFLEDLVPDRIYFYGTGCASDEKAELVANSLKAIFPSAHIEVTHDLMAAARALCGHGQGLACILGTGSSVGYYDGTGLPSISTGLGYVLGDEGSGAYLGRKVIQYYLYHTFDEELAYRFEQDYKTGKDEILENVYRKPLPNRYLASFTHFLSANRGHYMIENIIEDGLNDFFFTHLCKFAESWKHPIHFTGSIAWYFRDIIVELCSSYEFELGKIIQTPMEGLLEFHCSG